MDTGQTQAQARFSIPSIIAIAAAVGSLFTGAFAGTILALIAIAFGIIGALLAMSPRIRGGFISIFSLVIAGVGIILAIVRVIGKVL
jgi:hypothetical protein